MSGSNSKLFFGGAGLIAAAAVLVFLIIMPQLRGTSELRSGIAGNERRLQIIGERLRAYEAAKAQLSELSTQQAALRLLFPEREELVVAVESVESAAAIAGVESELAITDYKTLADSGVKVTEKPRPPLAPGLTAVEEVPFTLKVTGNYQALANFFRYLEHEQALVRFGSMETTAELEKGEGEKKPRNTGRGEAVLEGAFFIRK